MSQKKKDITFPANESVATWSFGQGIKGYIVSRPIDDENPRYLCFARLKSRPLHEKGTGGIISFVPAHGGVTRAFTDRRHCMIYGFDYRPPHKNFPIGWHITLLRKEVEKMIRGINAATIFENDFLNANGEKEKAKVIRLYHQYLFKNYGIRFDLTDGFAGIIREYGPLLTQKIT